VAGVEGTLEGVVLVCAGGGAMVTSDMDVLLLFPAVTRPPD
jgi:hypothetical protein